MNNRLTSEPMPSDFSTLTFYLTSDTLGSTRIVTDANGVVKSRHDYLPFGEEIDLSLVTSSGRTSTQGYQLGNVRQKFTQKERDAETGLDYFGARYYANISGRFTSCDPVSRTKAHLTNPQRWNLYVYVINNPIALQDPDGREDKGKGAGKIIDIFLGATQVAGRKEEIQRRIQEGVEGTGAKVTVHGYDQSTGDNVAWSLKSRDARTTIVMAHSTEAMEIGNDKKGNMKLGGTAALIQDGKLTAEGFTPYNIETGLSGPGVKFNINARNFILLSCRLTPDMLSGVAGRMTTGSNLIANSGGADGNCNFDTMVELTITVVNSISNDEDITTTVERMQGVNEEDAARMGPGSMADGDQIIRLRGQRQPRR